MLHGILLFQCSGTGDTTQLGGPIKIAKITGQVAKLGFIAFRNFLFSKVNEWKF